MSTSPGTSTEDNEVPEAEGGEVDGVMTVNSAIDDYISMAKRRKATIVAKMSKSKDSKVNIDKNSGGTTDPSEVEQLMLAIGKMYHCQNRGRGVIKRGVPPTNIIFKKNCSYQHMLERCLNIMKYEKNGKLNFYLADSKGVPIWTVDTISIDSDDGEKEIPWTLINFIRHSNIRYPSKAKIYVVEKECVSKVGEITDASTSCFESTTADEYIGKEGEISDKDSDASTSAPESTTAAESIDAATPANIEMPTALSLEHSCAAPGVQQEVVIAGQCFEQLNTEFEVLFAVVKKSQYRKECSTRITTQLNALSCDDYWKAEDYVHQSGHQPSIFPDNPCHAGYAFAGLNIEGTEGIHVIETIEDNGTVVLKKPASAGSPWGLWSGGLGDYGVAVLVSVVTGGYHSSATYNWTAEEGDLEGEIFPVLYTCKRGTYACRCTFVGVEVKTNFVVFGDEKWTVLSPPSASSDLTCIPTKISDTQLATSGSPEDGIAVERLRAFSQVDINNPVQIKLLEVIGQGSYGTVHRASWRGSLVAAKVIPLAPRDIRSDQVQREVDILRSLNHPHLACCLGVEKSSTNITIITPLVHGRNLQDMIFGDEKGMNLQNKFHILVQLCQALVFLHTSQPPLAHLDVKPANVMVDRLTHHTILTDFGLARLMSQTSSIGTKTMLAGSPGYQFPEQLRSESLGISADVYAFGGVMVVVLKECPLWPGMNFFQIMNKVTNGQTPNTDGIVDTIAVVCNQCFRDVE